MTHGTMLLYTLHCLPNHAFPGLGAVAMFFGFDTCRKCGLKLFLEVTCQDRACRYAYCPNSYFVEIHIPAFVRLPPRFVIRSVNFNRQFFLGNIEIQEVRPAMYSKIDLLLNSWEQLGQSFTSKQFGLVASCKQACAVLNHPFFDFRREISQGNHLLVLQTKILQ